MQTATKAPSGSMLDQKFISPFLHGVKDVFTNMVQLTPSAQSPNLVKNQIPLGDIAGVMPMKSPRVVGQLTVSFSKTALLDIASRMMMEEFSELEDIVVDTAGELTNIITGAAKAQLEKSGYNFDMARPSTYLAADFGKVELVTPRIVVPYEIPAGKFFIDLGFVPA